MFFLVSSKFLAMLNIALYSVYKVLKKAFYQTIVNMFYNFSASTHHNFQLGSFPFGEITEINIIKGTHYTACFSLFHLHSDEVKVHFDSEL